MPFLSQRQMGDAGIYRRVREWVRDTYEIVRREYFAILHFAWLPNPNFLHVPHDAF